MLKIQRSTCPDGLTKWKAEIDTDDGQHIEIAPSRHKHEVYAEVIRIMGRLRFVRDDSKADQGI
jgi:hypothetical protein